MLDRTTAYGLDFLFPAGDEIIGASLATHGEFARALVDLLLSYADGETGTFVDVGANIGSICLPFAAARRPWRVMAVEASRRIAAVLSANALANDLTNVEVVQAAAGAATGVCEFPDNRLDEQRNYGALSLHRPHHAMAKTLMAALDDLAPADTRLVKIDAEGEDANVLKGAQRLLHEVRPVWVVEAEPGYAWVSEPVIQTLMDAGYRVHWFWSPWVGRPSLKGKAPPRPNPGDVNVVALPPGVENSWDLTPVAAASEKRPGRLAAYPYLARYGMAEG